MRRLIPIASLIIVFFVFAWLGWGVWRLRQGYHAVFLSGGQVYFGMIAWKTGDELVLRKIYYIQPSTVPANGNMGSDISLLKLGQEVHGPEDEMRINRAHILFIERLKKESKLMKAIEAYQPPK